MKLGQRLNKLRTERALTINEVSRRLGISSNTYREWELGRQIMGEPYMDLAQVFNVSLTELMTGEVPSNEEHLRKIEECIRSLRSIL